MTTDDSSISDREAVASALYGKRPHTNGYTRVPVPWGSMGDFNQAQWYDLADAVLAVLAARGRLKNPHQGSQLDVAHMAATGEIREPLRPEGATMGEDAGGTTCARCGKPIQAGQAEYGDSDGWKAHAICEELANTADERDAAIVRAEKAEKERDAYREAVRERSLVLCETHRIGYSAKHGCAECKIAAVEKERDFQSRERAKEAGKTIAAEASLVAAQAERDRMRAALRDMRSLFKPSEKRAGVVYWTANNATTLRAIEIAEAAISPHDGGGGSGHWGWWMTGLNLGKFTGSDGAGGGGSGEGT